MGASEKYLQIFPKVKILSIEVFENVKISLESKSVFLVFLVTLAIS